MAARLVCSPDRKLLRTVTSFTANHAANSPYSAIDYSDLLHIGPRHRYIHTSQRRWSSGFVSLILVFACAWSPVSSGLWIELAATLGHCLASVFRAEAGGGACLRGGWSVRRRAATALTLRSDTRLDLRIAV